MDAPKTICSPSDKRSLKSFSGPFLPSFRRRHFGLFLAQFFSNHGRREDAAFARTKDARCHPDKRFGRNYLGVSGCRNKARSSGSKRVESGMTGGSVVPVALSTAA